MIKKDALEYLFKNLNNFFTSNKFKKTKKTSKRFEFKKETENGYYEFGLGIIGYDDEFQFRFSVNKQDLRIEKVCNHVLKNTDNQLSIKHEIDEDTISLGLTYDSDGTNNYDARFPVCKNEQDVQNESKEIIKFLETKAFPFFSKMDDLRELDKIINEDAFWYDDWMMPFGLGGNFQIKRLIIAKLSGNKNFEEIVDKQYKLIEKASLDNGYPFTYDRNDLTRELPFTVEYLKNVKSLY
jgi:hypothetical protein